MPKQTDTTPAFGDPIPTSVTPNEEPASEVRFILHDDMRMTFYVAGEAVLTISGDVTARLGTMLRGMPSDPYCFL